MSVVKEEGAVCSRVPDKKWETLKWILAKPVVFKICIWQRSMKWHCKLIFSWVTDWLTKAWLSLWQSELLIFINKIQMVQWAESLRILINVEQHSHQQTFGEQGVWRRTSLLPSTEVVSSLAHSFELDRSSKKHCASWLVISDAYQHDAQECRARESPPTADSHALWIDGMCGSFCLSVCVSVHPCWMTGRVALCLFRVRG